MNLKSFAREKELSTNSILKTPGKHIAIVCNGKSGKGKPLKLLPLFERYLNQHGFTYQIFTDNLPSHLTPFTDLIIMGGDGTLNYTLNQFRDIPIPIGIIRCGTGNDFADLLFGHKTIEQHLETAVFGTPKAIDAGTCNGKLFLNGVGIGFDGWVVKKLLAKKLFSGKAAYYSTVISLLFFYREREVTLISNNGTRKTPLFMLSVANGQTYGGGFKVAPKAKPSDGLLDLLVVTQIPLFTRLRYLPVIEKGKHLEVSLPFITYEQIRSITLQSDTPLPAHLDGELMVANSFEIEILPHQFLIRQ